MPDDPEAIRRRAHAIWEAEGRPEGREKEHWAQAEAELREAAGQSAYSEMEQPGAGRPQEESAVTEALEPSGAGVPPAGAEATEPGGQSR